VVWHESPRFKAGDVVDASTPPVVSASRATVDAASWAANGTFSVEVDGGCHRQALKAWDDQQHQNALVIGGDRILRFPSVAIRIDPGSVIAQLGAAGLRFGRPTKLVSSTTR
jgi:hypothetical protein